MVKLKDIPTEEIKVVAYKKVCPICGKEIVGSKPQQVSFNMGLHLDSHKGEDKQ